MQKVFIFVIASIALVAAESYLVQDEEGKEFYLTPVLSRQRRDDGPKLFGQGGANGQQQSGFVKLQNPNGSGGSIGYGHAKGYGHDLSVDAMVPVWSNKNRYGESTLNLGGGATQHFGGYGGDRNLDKRVGLNFVHRF